MPLSLRQKIAQTLCFGFSGTTLAQASLLKSWLSHADGLGALILFDYDMKKQAYGKNITSLEQVTKLNFDIKTFYQAQHPDMPLPWISIDVEGGRVDRLAKLPNYPILPSAKKMVEMSSNERRAHWVQHAKLLKGLHIDLNFAPVVDLELSPHEGIFGPLERCYSHDPDVVLEMARSYIQVLNQHDIMACLKHFPGHGSARGDSHLDFCDVSERFQACELRPFRDLIRESELHFTIMTAHVVNRQLDPLGLPATLSPQILENLLRKEFGYQGIIISDDLQMQAISKYYSRQEAILQTFLAGADMLIFGNQLSWDEPQEIIDEIVGLIQQRLLPQEKIERAFQRIMSYKLKTRIFI